MLTKFSYLKPSILIILLLLSGLSSAQESKNDDYGANKVDKDSLLVGKLNSLEQKISKIENNLLQNSFVRFALGFGITFPVNSAETKSYIVTAEGFGKILDNFIQPFGIVSAIISFDVLDNTSVILNVPLTDIGFSNGSVNNAIGLFNREISFGYGVSYRPVKRIPNLGFALILNVYRYEEPITYVVINKIYNQEPFTEINIDNIPKVKTTAMNLGFYLTYSF